MQNVAISAFLERVNNQEDFEGLYLRLRAGPSRRKAQLIHSNIEIQPDTESMLDEIQGYFEGWVWEDGDRCFIELMKARSTNPLDVVAVLPSDIVEMEEEEPEDFVEESAIKTLTDALVTMSMDANHRASISQQRFLQAVETMVDTSIEMAHAQAQLAVEKREEVPNWVTALSAISPAFGPLVGDIAKKLQAKQEAAAPEIEETETKVDDLAEEPATPPAIVPSAPQPNPYDARG